MKLVNCSLPLVLSLMILALSACANKETADDETPAQETPTTVEEAAIAPPPQPAQLPVRFQQPGFVTADLEAEQELEDQSGEYQLKVGATIRSTAGPQPLWDILNRLGALKGMSVSWASDVDQSVLVDVNIAAEDDFFIAIDNLLRQVDYYNEVEGNTIIVKYRETKKFFIAIPNMKGTYTTTTGGNYLTDREAATGTEGTIKITSDENGFDVWANIRSNLDLIMQQWATVATETDAQTTENATDGAGPAEATPERSATRRMASGGSYYTVDQSVGLITATAPRPLLDKVEIYLTSLKEELYRQVVIEAKIIEVYLEDNSKIGLDWSLVLKDFDITGTTFFGTAGNGGDGQVYPWIPAVGDADSITTFISKVTLNPANFSVMLNALNEQGDANVLSNPKLTVLNGQPALISVGKDIAYIKTVSQNIDSGSNNLSTITYTAEVDNVVEGVALGVVASIVNDEKVILHLTPVTTNLIDDPIEYRTFGDGLEVGLPRVGVRQMSTMVEVGNGEMLVIGGLIDEVDGKTSAFAPVVGEIPVIKYLFGYEEKIKSKRELVILLTPKII